MKTRHLGSELDHQQLESLFANIPMLLNVIAPICDDMNLLMNAIGTPIADDDELEARMELIDTLYSYAEDESDVAAQFAAMVALRASEYEARIDLPKISAGDALGYLLKVRGLKQSSLKGVANQSTVSEIISGKRAMTVKQIKDFSAFFSVPERTFLG